MVESPSHPSGGSPTKAGTEQSPTERLRESREGLSPSHEGASGRSAAEALSRDAERALAALWDRLPPVVGCVVAVGELGRRELGPGSPLELLVLHPPSAEAGRDVEQAVKALSFELWPAGVEVVASVLPVVDPAELAALAARTFDVQTAFLDGRLIAGNAAMWEATREAVLADTLADPGVFLDRLRRATAVRRAEDEDATAALEPNLRDGRGGLADVAAIGWIEAVCGPRELPVARAQLEAAADLIHRARAALHRYAGRGTNVLLLPHRRGVAEALFGADAGQNSEVALMRLLYEQCRVVAAALDTLLETGAVASPAVRRFAEAFSTQATVDPDAWPEEATRAFLEILASGAGCRPALVALDADGTLTRAIPEWAGIRCLPERRNYHRWAVDEHAFRAVAGLAALADDPDDGVRTAAAAVSADGDTVLVATLLHDVGKGGEHDHSERGGAMARSIALRMGLGEAVATDVAWLVRNHLLLAHMATRRDIGDDLLMTEVAERVGTERRLHLLYLLTVADGRATGPAAWTLWKATLSARLYDRVLQALQSAGSGGDDADARAEASLQQIRSALADLPRGPVEAHLAGMPRAWLMSEMPPTLAEQSRQMIDFHPGDDIRIRATPVDDGGLCELTVVARDRPGLFSRISGVLALHDLNVCAAEIYTRADGVALERFRLEPLSTGAPRFDRMAEDARKALRGRISLGLRLAEKRDDVFTGRASVAPPRVVVDNEASERFSVVEVHATDRVGLLYTITRALAELELDIKLAKVSTYGEEVVDVFYVADPDGQKITDPGYVSEIQALIAFAVAGSRPSN